MKTKHKQLALLGSLAVVLAVLAAGQSDYLDLQGRIFNPGSFTLNVSSPSGARALSATDEVLVFDATASTNKDMVMLAGDTINVYLSSSTNDLDTTATGVTAYLTDGTNLLATGPVTVSSDSKASAALTMSSDYMVKAGATSILRVVLDSNALMAEEAEEYDGLTAVLNYAFRKVEGNELKY